MGFCSLGLGLRIALGVAITDLEGWYPSEAPHKLVESWSPASVGEVAPGPWPVTPPRKSRSFPGERFTVWAVEL